MDSMDRRVVNNPLSLATIDRAIELLELSESAVVLDVGCGRGEILARTLERYGCRGIGVDPKADEIERARLRLAAFRDRVELHSCRIQEIDLSTDEVTSAFCIGATHAYGQGSEALPNTLATLGQLVKPGGTLLVGEGFWMREPPDEYLHATGFARNDLRTDDENIALARRRGLFLLDATTSSRSEWDHFERLTWDIAEDRLRDNPADEEARKQAAHWRKWREAYERWGQFTLGFGLYLFRRP